jgi:hypothetical protein
MLFYQLECAVAMAHPHVDRRSGQSSPSGK